MLYFVQLGVFSTVGGINFHGVRCCTLCTEVFFSTVNSHGVYL